MAAAKSLVLATKHTQQNWCGVYFHKGGFYLEIKA
jgi:hypothetical protein